MRLVASISVSLLCVKERKTQILCPLAPCVNVYPSNLPGTMCERGPRRGSNGLITLKCGVKCVLPADYSMGKTRSDVQYMAEGLA